MDNRAPLLPDLEPRQITMEEYRTYAPEKVELVEGYVFGGTEERRWALLLLLVNVGLLEAMRLVPEGRWREALERVYGPHA